MSIIYSALLPALISSVFGLTVSIITTKFTAKVEVKKQLSSYKNDKIITIFNEITDWVNYFRISIPSPRDAMGKVDISNFLKKMNDFDDWLTINFVYIKLVDEDLKNYLIIFRDDIKRYLAPQRTFSTDELIKAYNDIITTSLSNVIKWQIKVSEKLFK